LIDGLTWLARESGTSVIRRRFVALARHKCFELRFPFALRFHLDL